VTARCHNLPALRMPLIGREQDSAKVRDLVLQAPGRLVTLTGTGGCGKTQLALLVTAELMDAFADGAWLVELAAVHAPHLAPYAVAAVLGRRERAGEAVIDTLIAYLKTREVLLVLDNCEHLVDACAELAERLLSTCPRVRLLATSRERLRIGAETTWRVPSLESPAARGTRAPAELLAYPAVRLFVERAQAVEPDFTLSQAVAPTVADICARLEGLPLALELTAARVSTLSLAQILERLDDCFRLLVVGSRTAPTRQQTLRATLDWSHGLLRGAEQAVFRRLAAFSGGWSLEAAEAICIDLDTPAVEVLNILSQLVDKSLVLVTTDERDGRSRYRLLEPIRQYAQERLVASGEGDGTAKRHATYFLAFAEARERDASVGGAQRMAAAAALEAEYPNLQVALQRASDTSDAELGLRLAWALQFVWKFRLPNGEGRAWLEQVLALPGAEAFKAPRAVSLLTAARLAWERHDYGTAESYYAEGVPLARSLGDPWILFVALADQGSQAEERGDYHLARTFWQEALCVARTSGDTASEALLRVQLARLDVFEGNYTVGRTECEECLALARQLGDAWILHGALHTLALAALVLGDLAEARALASECLTLPATPIVQTGLLLVVVEVAIDTSEYAVARGRLQEALALLANSGDVLATARAIEAVAHLASRVGKPELALRLAGATNAARERPDAVASRVWTETLPHLPLFRDLRERWFGPLLKTVSGADANLWWAEGRALSLGEAVALANIELLDKSEPMVAVQAAAGTSAPLTPRQLEVAVLVRQGLTNRQIADRLVVTERAAAAHVERILDKLGVGTRAQIAAWAAEQGLLTTRAD
jgi:predicted ATPase/DNA-binding CsgD family transcriptional regulator